MRFSEDRLASFRCGPGLERRIHVWEPAWPRAVILAIHGGMAHGGDYVTPALYFRRHGIATVAYDLCGHQDARRVDIPGFHVFLDDSVRFLAWVKHNYPGLPIYVMGHSMGALIATHLGLGHFAGDPDIKGFILSSPYYVNAIKPAVLDFSTCAKPTWPQGAITAQRTGTVTLSFLVGADGKPTQSKVRKSSGHPDLDEASRDGIAKCTFKPATRAGKPVESLTNIMYVWTLE